MIQKIAILAVLVVATCLILFSNILHPINALIIPYQEQQTTIIHHVKGNLTNNTQINNNTDIKKLPPLQTLTVNDNYVPLSQEQYSIIDDPVTIIDYEITTTSNNNDDNNDSNNDNIKIVDLETNNDNNSNDSNDSNDDNNDHWTQKDFDNKYGDSLPDDGSLSDDD